MAKKIKKKVKKTVFKPEIPLTALPSLEPTAPKTQALLFTVATSNLIDVSRLITHYNYGDTLSKVDMNGSNCLHVATRRGDFEMVVKLLSYPQTPIDAREKTVVGGYSALHIACKHNLTDIAKELLIKGANPNLKSDSSLGETSLHICCKLGHTACASLLLRAGANADARDGFGHNASFWAASKQHMDMITHLELPPVHTASPQEHLAIMILNNPKFSLEKVKSGKKKSSKEKGRAKSPKKK